MPKPDAVLPQHATPAEAVITSVDWLFEPCWRGDRLVARLRDGKVTLTDAAGEPAGREFADAAHALATAIDADAAVIDGIWTTQPLMAVSGAPRSAEAPAAYVAIDLVELDGQSLADVPLGERRRLLASIIGDSGRVRISPAVRQPIRAWLDAWRRNGFTSYIAKHVNSRYRAGQHVDDWLILSSAEPEERLSLLGRISRRRRKPLRIED
jgi:bifunctional non-homologous end joining protein LigD